ncbi:MAG: ECF transporter S component [Lachnospira sp.]|nr:ECF transporter S component [Lachnospira sp.]
MKSRKIVMASLFTAIICVATLVIQIPLPTGYANLGDCFVLLAAWILGPLLGALAAAIGAMLSDILSGYVHYAVGTFIIKGLMALIAFYISKELLKSAKKRPQLSYIISAICAELVMVAGYCFYDYFIMGYGVAAFASILGNVLQGVIAIIAANLLNSQFRRLQRKNLISQD